MGFIAVLYLDGKYHQFSTYNHSKISQISINGEALSLEMKHKSHTRRTWVKKNSTGEPKAPATGNMSCRIKESNDSVVEVIFTENNKPVIFQETGQKAGLEIAEKSLTIYEIKGRSRVIVMLHEHSLEIPIFSGKKVTIPPSYR